jgi:hypothetical protein
MFWTLRHDYNCFDGATVGTDGRADAHVGLQQAVVPALAGPMKGKNHWPFLMRRPIFRNEYLIFEINGLDRNGAVDEPRLVFFCIGRDRDQEPKKQQKGQ